jgi:DnaK suppressor protein
MASLRKDPATARRVLGERHAEVADLLGSAEPAVAAEADPDRDDAVTAADELQQQAVAQDVERRRRQELARIDAALERLAAGEYGWCVACGKPIPEARLDLDPAVALCVACAEKQ